VQVGGRDGVYDETSDETEVQLQPGTHVEFASSTSGEGDNRAVREQILRGVTWAPDPANAATWPPVSDWVK
jgi:hypothetical protein